MWTDFLVAFGLVITVILGPLYTWKAYKTFSKSQDKIDSK